MRHPAQVFQVAAKFRSKVVSWYTQARQPMHPPRQLSFVGIAHCPGAMPPTVLEIDPWCAKGRAKGDSGRSPTKHGPSPGGPHLTASKKR